jgi:hypothetical protein
MTGHDGFRKPPGQRRSTAPDPRLCPGAWLVIRVRKGPRSDGDVGPCGAWLRVGLGRKRAALGCRSASGVGEEAFGDGSDRLALDLGL